MILLSESIICSIRWRYSFVVTLPCEMIYSVAGSRNGARKRPTILVAMLFVLYALVPRRWWMNYRNVWQIICSRMSYHLLTPKLTGVWCYYRKVVRINARAPQCMVLVALGEVRFIQSYRVREFTSRKNYSYSKPTGGGRCGCVWADGKCEKSGTVQMCVWCWCRLRCSIYWSTYQNTSRWRTCCTPLVWGPQARTEGVLPGIWVQ